MSRRDEVKTGFQMCTLQSPSGRTAPVANDGGAGDEGPADERDDGPSADAGANVNAVRRADRLAGADADGVDHGDGDGRVPGLHANVRARGARLGAAILRRSSIKVRARTEAAAFREVEEAKARRR